MITTEDVLRLWRLDVPKDAIKTLNVLLSERDEALKWKEAYRKLAIKYGANEDFKEESKWFVPPKLNEKIIDAEARQIFEESK